MSRRARNRIDKRDLPEVLERYAKFYAPIEEQPSDDELSDLAWQDAIAEKQGRSDEVNGSRQ